MGKFLSAVCLSLVLSGCVAAAVGGAGAGGYYVGNDERPVKVIASDASITTKVNTKYVGSKIVSAFDINVDTYNGVVTLQGNVPSYAAEAEAVRLARSVDGVKRVVSRLTIAK